VEEAGDRTWLLAGDETYTYADALDRVLRGAAGLRRAGVVKGDRVLVHGQLVRRFYRSGAGARSLTEVVASGIKKLEEPAPSG